jgi:polysaccharide pyruvyl transferase WcaK-like protein
MEPEPVRPEIVATIEAWRKKSTVIGLNISKLLYMGGYTGNNMFALKDDYPKLVRALIRFLIEDLQAFVLLVPHVYGGEESAESEVTLCRQLLEELKMSYPGKIAFLDEAFNHRQIKYVIGKCDAFVGARMHACIAAVSQCVPTVALAYSDKFAGVMEAAGVAVRVVDLRAATINDACAAVSDTVTSRAGLRRGLQDCIPGVKARVQALFESKSFQQFLHSVPNVESGRSSRYAFREPCV